MENENLAWITSPSAGPIFDDRLDLFSNRLTFVPKETYRIAIPSPLRRSRSRASSPRRNSPRPPLAPKVRQCRRVGSTMPLKPGPIVNHTSRFNLWYPLRAAPRRASRLARPAPKGRGSTGPRSFEPPSTQAAASAPASRFGSRTAPFFLAFSSASRSDSLCFFEHPPHAFSKLL